MRRRHNSSSAVMEMPVNAPVSAPVDPATIAAEFEDMLAVTADPAFQAAGPEGQAAILAAAEMGVVGPVDISVESVENPQRRNPAKFDRCVREVRASLARHGQTGNEYAICTAAGARENPRGPYKVVSPATGTEHRTKDGEPFTEYSAFARAKEISLQHPRSFAKVVESDGYETGYVNGKIAHLVKGVWVQSPEVSRAWMEQLRDIGRRRRHHNPEAAAATLSESFHGAPAHSVTEIAETVHYHENLADLATLTCIVIHTESGYSCTLKFPRPGSKHEVRLASSEDGTSMYFVGGDQKVDLAALHMSGPKWEKDLMVLGRVKELEYFTTKAQDNFKPSIYWHKSREGLTPDGTKHTIVADRDPVLLYDLPSALLQLAGGQYSVEEPGIVG